MQSAKSLQMYGLDKFGITVVKESNAFASKVTRFIDKEAQEKQRVPGPGQYEGVFEKPPLRKPK